MVIRFANPDRSRSEELACWTRRAFPARLDSLSPAMPHFTRVAVKKVGRHNSLCLFVSIPGRSCSVYVCRRMQQNYTAEITLSSQLHLRFHLCNGEKRIVMSPGTFVADTTV